MYSYYDNSKGSIYFHAYTRNWSSYMFDIIKRMSRGGKKDPLCSEVEKSLTTLSMMRSEGGSTFQSDVYPTTSYHGCNEYVNIIVPLMEFQRYDEVERYLKSLL